MFSGCFSSGFQNVVSLIQQASFSTRSLKPKASNISIVRQAMPSAWPRSSGPGLLLDDAGLDVGKGGQLRRQRQAGRPAADDEDVDLLRHGAGRSGRGIALRRIGDLRVAGLESVQMKLHETSRVSDGPSGADRSYRTSAAGSIPAATAEWIDAAATGAFRPGGRR